MTPTALGECALDVCNNHDAEIPVGECAASECVETITYANANVKAVSAMQRLYYVAQCTKTEPDFRAGFMAHGGSLAVAAMSVATDVALTHSPFSDEYHIHGHKSTALQIPLPTDSTDYEVDVENGVVKIDASARILLGGWRLGASIGGTLGLSESGRGSALLVETLQRSHLSIPLEYTNFDHHSAVVTVSGAHIADGTGRVFSVECCPTPAATLASDQAAEAAMSAYADAAWSLRMDTNGLPYVPAMQLTKTVAQTCQSLAPTGLNGSGYDMVHNVISAPPPHTWTTINSLLQHAVATDLDQKPDAIDTFMNDTRVPGLKAANRARVIAGALSTIAAHHISYRADGVTCCTPNGQITAPSENWPTRPFSKFIGTGDCDDSALGTHAILQACVSASADVRAAHPYIRAAHHVLFPHYTIGVAVLGATSAEASGATTSGEVSHSTAGHAATFLVPSVSILRALKEGHPLARIECDADALAKARLEAVFDGYTVDDIGEKAALSSWREAHAYKPFLALHPFAVEGTCPASPILYPKDASQANAAKRTVAADGVACARVGATVGRSVKIMYGIDKHAFYEHVVEFNVSRHHPLWKHPSVRALDAATSQLCMVSASPATSGGPANHTAGVTPSALVAGNFSAVPLSCVSGDDAVHLDDAAVRAASNTMPPTRSTCVLSEPESHRLATSNAYINGLSDTLARGDGTVEGHCVAYVVAFNTLVHNPLAVKHMCQRISAVAAGGAVDMMTITDFARSSTGDDVGQMVVINALIP